MNNYSQSSQYSQNMNPTRSNPQTSMNNYSQSSQYSQNNNPPRSNPQTSASNNYSQPMPPSQNIRRTSSALDKPVAKVPQNPNVFTSPYVVADPTIRPSILKQQDDPLQRYRVKSEETVNPTPSTNTVPSSGVTPVAARPSLLREQSDDPLSKYRVKSPEEEEVTWEIYLRNLPAESVNIVEFFADDKKVFAGFGSNGVVTENFNYTCKPGTTSTHFCLKISFINFNLNKTLDITKGRFIRFSVDYGQMKFRQQKTHFED
eukprot:TRINITY_DN904_c0_g2_i2.p1 TRINITY_DN904_c0_g2~~TRINITY_DN904_c0_g2_i2.p1  ORF type:complete len:260 (-),score=43.88 TRINITY_DN904_c0_g2_i2:213-992(-)